MIDEKLARLRNHRNSISRYNRLLQTDLTELERRFIEKRVSEERTCDGSSCRRDLSNPLPVCVAGDRGVSSSPLKGSTGLGCGRHPSHE